MAKNFSEIYEKFREQLINNGWKGVLYGWQETVRSELNVGTWRLLEYGNGFYLGLDEPIEGFEGEASLQYWFDGEKPVSVTSLAELLELLK